MNEGRIQSSLRMVSSLWMYDVVRGVSDMRLLFENDCVLQPPCTTLTLCRCSS